MYFENLHYFGMPNTKKYGKNVIKKIVISQNKIER